MIRISNIKMDIEHTILQIKQKIAKKLKIKVSKIKNFEINKKSIDARNKEKIFIIYSVDFDIEHEHKYLKLSNITKVDKIFYQIKKINKDVNIKPVIVGSGPAGLFCALILSQAGLKPILIERGKDVSNRKKDIYKLFENAELNTESNIQFGEGGAGTFSDGKLTTGIKDFRIKKIMQELVEAGAPQEILYCAKPHLGTDILCDIVANIRKKIEIFGGHFRFSTRLDDIFIKNNVLEGIEISKNDRIEYLQTQCLILATGHSARDTFRMMSKRGIFIQKKPFAVGMRIEHSQKEINKIQYGKFYDKLGSADYKISTHVENSRCIFTFCMCPGGEVVCATSLEGHVVTNGMSNSKRNKANANSAILVNITEKDVDENTFALMDYQDKIEKKAFELGGSNYKAPVQLLGDFMNDKKTTNLGEIYPSYKPGFTFSNLQEGFDEKFVEYFKKGIIEINKKFEGFYRYDAVLTGFETRTSSPVKIVRDENFMTNIKNIFVCGEGSGYAGGIVSSAVDGIKCAEKIIKYLNV